MRGDYNYLGNAVASYLPAPPSQFLRDAGSSVAVMCLILDLCTVFPSGVAAGPLARRTRHGIYCMQLPTLQPSSLCYGCLGIRSRTSISSRRSRKDGCCFSQDIPFLANSQFYLRNMLEFSSRDFPLPGNARGLSSVSCFRQR